MRSSAIATAVALVALASPVAGARAAITPIDGDAKRVCVYSAHRQSVLREFERLVGRDVDCVLVYNDAAPDWAGWESPWYLTHRDPDLNWSGWATAAGHDRQLIITQNLFPASENTKDWRQAGARGDYDEHARTLARNLVAAGVGSAVIRLAHEANGDWYPDSIGSTDAEFDLWRQFWRRTVLAMRSVPGANFRFDWCVNGGYRAIPLDKYYPGDDVVDFVGIDAYDAGVPAGVDRWNAVYNRRSGIREVLEFAKAHGKPLSIPEWGVGPANVAFAGGDNPTYVNGIASVVERNPVAYQSYFYAHDWATQLATGPLSLAAYRAHFGADAGAEPAGLAAPAGTNGDAVPAASPAPVAGAPLPTTAAVARPPVKAKAKAAKPARKRARTRRKRRTVRVVRRRAARRAATLGRR